MDDRELNILVAIAEASERILVNQKTIMGIAQQEIVPDSHPWHAIKDSIDATNPVLNNLRRLIP